MLTGERAGVNFIAIKRLPDADVTETTISAETVSVSDINNAPEFTECTAADTVIVNLVGTKTLTFDKAFSFGKAKINLDGDLLLDSATEPVDIAKFDLKGVTGQITRKWLIKDLPVGTGMAINFNQGQGKLGDSDEAGIPGLTIYGNVWNNTDGGSGSLAAAKMFAPDGTTVIADTMPVSWTGNLYQWTGATTGFLKGYLDDSGITFSATVPFDRYDVYIICATDTENATFGYKKINGVNYSADANGVAIANSTAAWGASRQMTPILGKNVMYLEGFTAQNFAITESPKGNGRGCIAAIVIVKAAPPEPPATATVSADTDWSKIVWSKTIEDASKADLELTVENGATITLDGAFAYGNLRIIGDVTFVAPDSIYEDGCWEKTLLTGIRTFETTGTISFGAVKTGFYGAYTQTANGISLRAQNKEVISINIAGGKSGGSGSDSENANLVSGTAFYGIAPTLGDSWNNINRRWQDGGNQTISIESPNAYDGNEVIARPTMSLSATGKNTWNCDSISNPFLRGYLDDGNGVTVEVHGVPYSKYDVIVYATSDDSSIALAPITINGTQYTFKDSVTKPGSDVWGVGQYATPEIGKNALRVNDCTGDTVTINATRTGGRATLCAVQVINKGEVMLKDEFAATITESIKFSEITTWNKTFKEGQLNEVTITVGEGEGEVELEFDNPDMMLAKLVINSDRDIRFKATKALSNIGQFIITGCTGKVTYAWPVSELKTAANGVTYAAGSGSEESPAPINFSVQNGSMTLKDGTFYIGTTYSAVTSTVDMVNATVYANGDMGFGVGQATFNLSGTTKLTTEKVVLSQGGDGRTSVLALGDSAEIMVTGTNVVDSNQSSIMFGHWNGPSTFSLDNEAKFTAPDAQVLIGKTGNDQTINIYGGTFTAKGIKASGSATGENTLNLSGGELKIGEFGISSYSTARTIQVVVDGDAKITSTAAMPITQPVTINQYASLTLDATAGDIVLSGAVENNGKIKIVGGTAVFMPGTFGGEIETNGIGRAVYGYYVDINNCGKFAIPEGKTVEEIKLFNAADEELEIIDSDETYVYFDWEVTGGTCWWDYEFEGNDDNAGTDGARLQWDGGHPRSGAEYTEDGELYISSSPWRGGVNWPTQATFVMYGTMVCSNKTYQIGFGSTYQGQEPYNTIFLATDTVSQNTVNLCICQAKNAPTVLCQMTVPNAQTAKHLYAFTLKTVEDKTVVDIYLDGELLQSYPFDSQIVLGTGFQIGSGHGGICAGYNKTVADDPAVLDFLRVYKTELTATAH